MLAKKPNWNPNWLVGNSWNGNSTHNWHQELPSRYSRQFCPPHTADSGGVLAGRSPTRHLHVFSAAHPGWPKGGFYRLPTQFKGEK